MPIYVNKNNQQSGPYEDRVILDQLRSGLLSDDDLGIRQGESSWQRLGEMFPGVGRSQSPGPPIGAAEAASGVATASASPAAKKGGCLKPGLIVAGLLFLLLGISIAAGSRFIPSVSCDLAEADANKIDKLEADLDKATKNGNFDKIGPLQRELTEELSGAAVSEKYCDDDKFRNNAVGVAGGAMAFVGFLMALIGMFVGRGK